jgi:hypothetical protein
LSNKNLSSIDVIKEYFISDETLNLFVNFVFQEGRIKNLEDTCEVDIELNKRLGRIMIRGLPENLSEAVGDVHKIILDVDRQKQKHQHAQLVKDMVQWYFISVKSTIYLLPLLSKKNACGSLFFKACSNVRLTSAGYSSNVCPVSSTEIKYH